MQNVSWSYIAVNVYVQTLTENVSENYVKV